MRESMNRDGEVGEGRSMMILKVSVSMDQRLSREVTMIDIGDIDIHILIGIGVMRGAEAGQESTGEGDHGGKLKRRAPNSINYSCEMHDRMRSMLRLCERCEDQGLSHRCRSRSG